MAGALGRKSGRHFLAKTRGDSRARENAIKSFNVSQAFPRPPAAMASSEYLINDRDHVKALLKQKSNRPGPRFQLIFHYLLQDGMVKIATKQMNFQSFLAGNFAVHLL